MARTIRKAITRRMPAFTPCGYCFERWATCWDHLVPYSYDPANEYDNLYPSCRRCNGLLSDLMFATIEEKREYVRKELEKRAERKAEQVRRRLLLPLQSKIPKEAPPSTLLLSDLPLGRLGSGSPARYVACCQWCSSKYVSYRENGKYCSAKCARRDREQRIIRKGWA